MFILHYYFVDFSNGAVPTDIQSSNQSTWLAFLWKYQDIRCRPQSQLQISIELYYKMCNV